MYSPQRSSTVREEPGARRAGSALRTTGPWGPGAPENWGQVMAARRRWRGGGDGPVMNLINLLGISSPLIVAAILLGRHYG